ncbi:unnamed protein product [Lactuca virosa]|uniref:Uncharacterized protein n=1 Tax=Lactuca virosa TaxID=75947 RepID=A0AAU9M5K7_9ASTR|nr:unnamed protein product [Lactuca virosa]
MSQYLKTSPTVTCVVIVMQFVKLNIWDGIGQAQSYFDTTKQFINSDIIKFNELKKELKATNNGGMSEKSITSLPSSSSSYMDDFKGDFPLKAVCEITKPLKVMRFLLVGSIINIRQSSLAGDSLEVFPNQINVLKNCKFAFLVDITHYNVDNYNNIYTIVKLTKDVSILSELERKIELMAHESFTRSTVDKSTAASPINIANDLKRNLYDVYDVDCGGDLSSTKFKRKSIGEENPLLVPKVEK